MSAPAQSAAIAHGSTELYWRAEGSLLNLSAVRPLGYFTWNAQTFSERWARRGLISASALLRPLLYAANRAFATRALHTVLRGVSRDRLDLLGEEFFEYVLRRQLREEGVRLLKEALAAGARVVLVSQALDHVLRPMALYLGAEKLVANRLEFREGRATGRLLDPVIRPRGALALVVGGDPDGRVPLDRLARDLGFGAHPETILQAIIPSRRETKALARPAVRFDGGGKPPRLSVRQAFEGKHILLVGVTGFIGKVWLAELLGQVPGVGRITVLVRRRRSASGLRRFERLVGESPVFEPLAARYRAELGRFLAERIEVVEGDAAEPLLGMEPETYQRLKTEVDLVVNSSGLTDFNPDLREALAANVAATLRLAEFLRDSRHAALLHLSSCYVAGRRDGRIAEQLLPNYTPRGIAGFDAEREWRSLEESIREVERRAEQPEVTELLRRDATERRGAARELSARSLENQIRKNRIRWIRQQLVDLGMRRAAELGWPNTYTLTKSLAESLLAKYTGGLPVAVVRPSIVETSIERPFRGWNEGVNTSASLSYLLGTNFRQFPSNERKNLDLIPVDLVARGMTLVAAALLERRHALVYQLATSVSNPCDMRRSIELTGLAHRKHYRGQEGLESWLRMRFDAIPVSKQRYKRLSAPAQKAVVRRINRLVQPIFRRAPFARQERDLTWVENLIALFEPFILDNQHDFEAENVRLLSEALAEDERSDFGYDPFSIDWWDYWINIHVPALRRWSYPLIEGRPIELAPRPFEWPGLARSADTPLPAGPPRPGS
ncbi:MAG TPA: SDR family oxidoreductase [Candidatus Acidoferrales bacterium]|nr:SDR family oxidoreductase [Candidatus Acidoferrales bacterium]